MSMSVDSFDSQSRLALDKIFGNYIDPEDHHEYLILRISPSSRPLEQRWRNNGLTADFLADYWSTFFSTPDAELQRRQQAIIEAVSYIANELLENMMKFGYRPAVYPSNLSLYLYPTEIRFYAGNAVDPQKLKEFQSYIEMLLTQDPYALYVQQVEHSLTGRSSASQLGYITIINNFGGRLSWKFENRPSGIVNVTTLVRWTWQNWPHPKEHRLNDFPISGVTSDT